MKFGISIGTVALSALMLVACGKSDLSNLEPGETTAVTAPVEAPSTAEKIKIVGSSTVSPFATTVAERFGATSGFPTPIVETTGTGGGFKAFCQGIGADQPSISNASRTIKSSETELCAGNGVTDITEIKVGFDGIVVANSKTGPDFDVTKEQLYLALAKDIPDGAGGFKANPYKMWNEIDPSLPAEEINVLGAPRSSGTRDAFVELGMEEGAKSIPAMAELKSSDGDAYKDRTHTIRTDGAWIDSGENDAGIIQSLVKTPAAIGILGFSFLDQNADRVKGAKLAGVDATFDNIASGDYGLSRVMFFYVKDQNVPLVAGLPEYVTEFTSDNAMGPDGYLIEKGLIPLTEAVRAEQQTIAAGLAN